MPMETRLTPKCPGCSKAMALVDGKANHYMDKSKHGDKFYVCTGCNYEIRCFPGTLKPMGRPADGTLRDERRWVGIRIDDMVKRKVDRDRCISDAARTAAWKWVSKIVGKEVVRIEDLNIPEMGDLIPELRKFS